MKLGIVGSGMIVGEFLSFIHEIKDIQLIHISGTQRSEEKLKQIVEQYGFERYSTNYEQLLNDRHVDTIYIALPNHLHFEFARKALQHHKHVIIEKPMTSTYQEALSLQKIAMENHLFLWEAITNQYLPHYQYIKDHLHEIGNIKIVQCHFCQYSSRYQKFLEGDILPVFDYTKSGGALMDINIYNIHFVVGLFGEPQDIHYYPCIEHHIDTSGVLVLQYPHFQCVCIGAKDCQSPSFNTIQGEKGYFYVDTPSSFIKTVEWVNHDGTSIQTDHQHQHVMYAEMQAFVDMYQNQDYQRCYKVLKHSLTVCKVQTIARRKAGILFPADQVSSL